MPPIIGVNTTIRSGLLPIGSIRILHPETPLPECGYGMTDPLDEFESIFKRAEREQFVFADIPINSIAIITDQDQAGGEKVKADVLEFMPRLADAENWQIISGDKFHNVSELLGCIEQFQVDLIVTWRHLDEESLVPQHSLGVYLDVLTQTTSIPVLVLPGTAENPKQLGDRDCDKICVLADHISGDNRLINYGIRFCRNGGKVWLCHIEDERDFDRYMHAIARIPEIDTDDARKLLGDQLLKDADDFIESCIEALKTAGPNIGFEKKVSFGHFLRQYRDLIDSNDIDLCIANTKDDDQLAMHGIAYSLSIELDDVPMLLL